MGYLGCWHINDYVTFACNTHDPETGAATDADAVPTYRVYEDETGTAILSGSMAKLDDSNTTGFYSERIQLTAANGFEKDKSYTVYISAVVNGTTGTISHLLQVEDWGWGWSTRTLTDGVALTAAAVDDIWNEVLTSATHDVSYSAGQRLRLLILTGGAAQGGTTNTITLAATESSTDDIFIDNIISIVSGAGAGQTRLISEYVGATRVATVDKNWFVNPAAGSVYEILPFAPILLSNHGIVQAGTASTITLNAGASSADDIYIGSVVYIATGTGAGQVRVITDYVGSTKVATISDNWTTTPDNTSVYKVLPVGRVIVDSLKANSISAAVLAADAVAEIQSGLAQTGADSDTLETLSDQLDDMDSTDTAAAVWAYDTRTLTVYGTTSASASDTEISQYRGDTWTISLTSLGNLSGRTKLWFTIKESAESDYDSAALVRVEETAGLEYINGTVAATAANASISVTDAVVGNITITIEGEETAKLPALDDIFYDVQMLTSSGPTTIAIHTFNILADVTRATA